LEIFGEEDQEGHSDELKLTITENDQSVLFYENPGKIINQRLIDYSEVLGIKCIKKTLVEYFDYEVVSRSVWQHLYSWYSADTAICREIVRDNKKSKDKRSHQLLT